MTRDAKLTEVMKRSQIIAQANRLLNRMRMTKHTVDEVRCSVL